LVGSIAEGELCPPLKGADGLLKAKAMVLAADYL